MKLTHKDYMEFIASLTPEQVLESSIAFYRAMPPLYHLSLQKAQSEHMKYSMETMETVTETYSDGSKKTYTKDGRTNVHGTFDIVDTEGKEL